MSPDRPAWWRRLREAVARRLRITGEVSTPAHLRMGKRGEKIAADYLKRRGFRVLGRNFVTPAGEADIVAESADRAVRIVVEVKTRSAGPGYAAPLVAPEAAIDTEKRTRLVQIGRHLAKTNGWRLSSVRIDVIAVELVSGRAPVLRHYEDCVM